MDESNRRLMQEYLGKIDLQRRVVQERIIGLRQFIESLFICFYSHSERKLVPHLLVEGGVGQGKTATLDTFAKTISGVTFKRISFTADILPQSLLQVTKRTSSGFEFFPGPLIANLVLADEINRAHEKTRSSLLEAMGEEQATIEGVTAAMERPFFLMATENPLDIEGTYKLDAAQSDRFMMKVYTEPLSEEEERKVIDSHQEPALPIQPVVTKDEVLQIRDFIRKHIFVHREIIQYVIRLVSAVRPSGGLISAEDKLALPEGARAPIFFVRGAKTLAFLRGRTYVVPDDIDALAFRILNHRIVLRYGGDVTSYIVNAVRMAREDGCSTDSRV